MLKKKYHDVVHMQVTPVRLVDVLDAPTRADRSWFRNFLNSILSSPDLDYSQFERLESKRTRQQMERGNYY
jgi:hypothetical protein